jgi:FKBP-type peptidyl-prolyl cis-trans isomerase FklB
MRNYWLAAVLAVFFCGPVWAAEKKGVDLTSPSGKLGYSIGYQLGLDFKAKGVAIETGAMAAGAKAAMEGSDPALGKDEMKTLITDVQQKVEAERRNQYQKAAADNKQAGEKFLDENSAKEGVTTLPSGLQYKVLKMGDGPKPTATSKVTVHYRGTLPDGSEFDSSLQRGQPATFQVNRVVPGWTEALQLMPLGSKWMLYLPSALGYGERGAPPRIGPNQVLIFEVELLKVE